ncbi:MAG: glycosyltransferase, partial [Candidatus Aquicultor sp.]
AAGHYAAGALAAHIALFVPGAIVMVAFPHLAAGKGLDSKSRRVFIEAIVAITTLSVVVATGMSLFSGLTIRILFGQSYLSSVPLIAPLAFTSVGFGLTSTLIYFQLARRSKWALTPWLGVLSAGALISLVHSSTVSIATSMLVVSWVTTLVTAVPVIQAYLAVSASDAAGELKWFDLPAQELDLTVVIPFFNPGPRLAQHVRDVTSMLEESGLSFEILAVSDGSTDHSEETLASQASDRLRLICLSKNQGKGAALRVGLAEGRGEYLGFIDGDGDIPPASLRNLLDVIGGQRPDVIFGSKRHPDSDVIYPMLRRIYSWGYQQLNHLLFRLPVRDTQTGVKVVRRDVLAEVLPRMVEKRFAFDLELFVVARQLGYTHFVEVPVSIRERFSSTISWRSVKATLIDTAAIFYRLRLLHFYNRDRGIASRSEFGGDHETPPMRVDAGTTSSRVDTRVRSGTLRILIFNWRDLAHPKAGGAEIYTHRVAEEWVKSGHDVTLFCAAVEGRPGLDSLNGVRIIRRGSWLSVYSEARNFYLGEGRGSFDLVVDEVNTRPFGASRWVDDVPVVALAYQVCRELWFYQTPFPIALMGRFIFEPFWLRRLRDLPVITISESSKLSLEQYGLDRVIVIPVGHEMKCQRPAVTRESKPTVIFVGRLEGHKRPDDAIRAFALLRAELRDAQMWVIGTGPMERELRRLASDGVEFLGRLSEEEKLERLARAHVLVATSVREGWGLVVTEAASVGTPTIAYNVDGLRDSVQNSHGVLVRAVPEALGSALHESLLRWRDTGQPLVTTGSVISWNGVANDILMKSLEETNYHLGAELI